MVVAHIFFNDYCTRHNRHNETAVLKFTLKFKKLKLTKTYNLIKHMVKFVYHIRVILHDISISVNDKRFRETRELLEARDRVV